MRKLIAIYLLDEVSFIRLISLFKIGNIHPATRPGIVRGFIIGIWRFEIQLILGLWNKSKEETIKEGVGHA